MAGTAIFLVHLIRPGWQLPRSRHFHSEIHLLLPQFVKLVWWSPFLLVILTLGYGTFAGFLGPGAKAMTGGINWLDSIAKQHFRSILHSLRFLLIKKLRPCALGKELNLSLALLIWLGLPVPRDHDIHSAGWVTTWPPSRSIPKWG